MISIWPKSLFGRNVLLLAAMTLLSFLLSFTSIYTLILNAQINRLTSIGAEMVNTISEASFELSPDAKNALIKELNDSRYLQVLPPGVTPEIGDYRENFAETMVMQRMIDQLDYQNEMDWRIGANRTLWLHLRIGDEFYWVAAESETNWTPLRWFTFLLFSIVGLLTTIGVIATRQISKPLAALERETDRWSLGADWSVNKIRGPKEVMSLSTSFQRMAERLQEAESIRAETLAEFSHDLRTPLARLRLAVEMMDDTDDLKDSASRQVQQIDRLIGQFVDYARAGQTEQKSVFDLSALAIETAAHFNVDVDIAPNLLIEGQKEFIRRAIMNLIENAEKYGAPPIHLHVSKTATHAVIEVRDMGEGFDLSQAKKMLQSFKRGTHQKQISGSGLGLAIVERAALAHHGDITFARDNTTGFIARLSLRL